MVRIVINADDLGLNKTVNAEIIDCICKGYVSSSTMLANGSAAQDQDIPELVRSHPNVSFGVHLNLSTGVPLTNRDLFQKFGIADADGSFIFNAANSMRRLPGGLKEAVYCEWKAQIERILDLGISASHIDGHHHIHIHPDLFGIVVRLMHEFAIPKVRIKYRKPFFSSFAKKFLNQYRQISSSDEDAHVERNANPYREKSSLLTTAQSQLALQLWHFWVKRIRSIKVADYFYSYESFCRSLNDGLRFKDNAVVELMCHPGNPRYANETMLLRGNDAGRLLKGRYLLNSYNEL